MSAYLDASVLVALFVADAHTPAAWRFAGRSPDSVLSAWGIAEFSSALSLQVRIGRLGSSERERAEAALDRWIHARPEPLAPIYEDYFSARRILRAVRTPLRAPDALHLAIAQRGGLALATFDATLSAAAAEAGVELVDL